MNHDKNESQVNRSIAPELEARIVAWIAGEASPFEAAELERQIAEKPELAALKQQLENIHVLVGEAVRADREPLRLSSARRTKILEIIREPHPGEEAEASAKLPGPVQLNNSVPVPLVESRRKPPGLWRRGTMIAAGLAIAFTLQSVFRNSSDTFDGDVLKKEYVQEKSTQEIAEQEIEAPQQAEENARGAGVRTTEVALPESNQRQKVDDLGNVIAMERITAAPSPELTSRAKARDQFSAHTEEQPAIAENKIASSISLVTKQQLVDLGPAGKIAQLKDTTDAEGQYAALNSVAGTRHRRALSGIGGSSTVLSADKPGFTTPTTQNSQIAARFDRKYSSDVGIKLVESSFGDKKMGVAPMAYLATKPVEKSTGEALDKFKTGVARAEEGAADNRLGAWASPPSGQISLSPFEIRSSKSDVASTENQPGEAAPTAASSDVNDVWREKFGGAVSAQEPHSLPQSVLQTIFDAATIDKPLARPSSQVAAIRADTEILAAKEPVSTFSLHVSDVSFRLALAALARGDKPDPAIIRPEEFYNALDYGDPAPAMTEKISCRFEQSAHPSLQQRNLVRIAMKVPATGRGAGKPLRLTVLLDTSGSMEREDRAASVHRALEVLISLLGPNDRVTLIGFARQPRLLAEALPGDKASQLLDILAHTPAEGGTNLEEAIKLGAQLAQRQQNAQAQNRIVLLTDGAANLGNADPALLSAMIEALRQQGIAFDACGVGLDGIDDTILESLTRKGDGRYYVLNTPEFAEAGFARQLAGAFHPAAENVKVQVRFNPARVGNYRLLGFEQHRLKEEDFRNDKVDAAELAAEEAAVALYQVEVLPQGDGELGEVYVRFRDAATGTMVERSWTLRYDPGVPAFDRATPTMQLAGLSELIAEKLRGGPSGDAIKIDELGPVANALRARYPHEPRAKELVKMYEQMRRLYRD